MCKRSNGVTKKQCRIFDLSENTDLFDLPSAKYVFNTLSNQNCKEKSKWPQGAQGCTSQCR